MKYARPLRDVPSVKNFLESLNFPIQKYPKIVSSIINTEKMLHTYDNNDSTLISKSFRLSHVTEKERWELRTRIVEELTTQRRLHDDDDICLGKGGSLPTSEIKNERQAFLVIGLPASGKSSVSTIIAEKYGAVILDSDYAKRKLPEYEEFGASIVHEESNALILGSSIMIGKPKDFRTLLELASYEGSNIVIPKIGHSRDSIKQLVEVLINTYKYNVHLTLISLDRSIAVTRAIHRFYYTKRYVPLSMIFDDYSNEPTNTYHKLKSENNQLFKSFGIINTNVAPGKNGICMECIGENPADLFEKNQL
ncbi:zeta toxin family protein [Emticicia sp. 21SJ11W-3]|uniref:zeta toxin family protein n=1 Tax=Emticicia sp. 21SJ11W-3 TaxID=2916755 RepID=UPI00209CCEEA|nr:zeta toxin family protein [Emticicia sp. 21SJ11W-3]UTA66588.1 zeta toxin family protein [Emticicia sp. 21SJ11W-3]